MDHSLKQRITGALVLVSVGVIFLPTLFYRDERIPVDQTTSIPQQPNFPQVVIKPVDMPKPEPIVPVEEMFQPEVEQQQPDTSSQPEPEAMPTLDEKGIPSGWVLQVASFKARDNADNFSKQLVQKGYKSFVRSTKTSTGLINRVFIGPHVDKSAAKALKKELDKSLNINSLVVEFSP